MCQNTCQRQSGPSRRTFLMLSVGGLGGLVLGVALPTSGMAQRAEVLITPVVHVTLTDEVIILSKHLDKGAGCQGQYGGR